MRTGVVAALGVWLSLTAACGEDAPPTTAPSFQKSAASLTLRVGETVVFRGVDVAFLRVVEDSRCPVDVLCPWEGNAGIELAVGPRHGTEGPTQLLVLNTSHGPRSGEAWGLRFTLQNVTPSPVSTEPIPPDAYQAVLEVEAIR